MIQMPIPRRTKPSIVRLVILVVSVVVSVVAYVEEEKEERGIMVRCRGDWSFDILERECWVAAR